MKLKYAWAIGLGGVAGSLLRYGLGLVGGSADPSGFPVTTLLINWTGCFALGLLSERLSAANVPEWVRPAVETGVIGSFTTFSTFSVETARLIGAGRVWLAIAYVGLCMAGGFASAHLGHGLSRKRKAGES